MDGSHLSSKSSIRTSYRKPTYSGNRENEHESDSERGISKLQKPPANTKNFMSPTISAASKAVKTPRKKILAERNEDSSSPCLSEFNFSGTKTSNLAPKSEIEQTDNPNSSKILSHSDNKDEECENSFRPDDTTTDQPYDPIKNYLSPRPTYLRYRPNRRREIFLCEEIEAKFDGLSLNPSVSFDYQKSSDDEEETLISGSGSSISCFIEPESTYGTGRSEIIEELQVEEAIDEECEEGEIWTLKWVLKLVLVFLALVLSTAYISTMNSPTPPPALQFIRNLKNEYRNVQARILRTVTGNFGTENDDNYEAMEEASEMDFFEFEVPEIGILEPELPEDGIMVEIPDQVLEVVEEEAGGERIASNYDHHLLEETGELSGHTHGDIEPQETEILESMVDLSYVSLFRVLDHHEPAMLPPTDAANELSLAPSWCPSYPPSFAVGEVAGNSNKTIEGIVPRGYQAATAPTRPVLVEAGNDNDLKVTYDYKHGYAPYSLMYSSALSLAALVYLATLFYRRRRSRRSSQTVGSEGGVGDGITGREERPAAKIEQVEEGLLTTHADPSPPIQYGSPIPYVELLSARGRGRRRSSTSWIADSAQQQPTTLTTDMYSYGSMSTSRDVAGPSGAQQPTTSNTDIHSYGSFIGQEVINKKKDSKDEATLTPVRRSTRLHSRRAKSP